METLDAIRGRRAIKSFDPNVRISAEDENKLIESALQSPSSYNIQHWRLVKITDPKLRETIRGLAWNQAQITDASLLYVVCADTKAWSKDPVRYWKNMPQDVQAMVLPGLRSFYEGREQLQRDEAFRSVGFIAQTLMITAKDLGYDSCPMIGFDIEKVGQLIKLPQDHVVGMIVAIGKALKPAGPKPGFLNRHEVVFENTF